MREYTQLAKQLMETTLALEFAMNGGRSGSIEDELNAIDKVLARVARLDMDGHEEMTSSVVAPYIRRRAVLKEKLNVVDARVDAMEVTVLDEDDEGRECSICMESLHAHPRLPSCSHGFHAKCLKTWLQSTSNQTCPVCRANVFSK